MVSLKLENGAVRELSAGVYEVEELADRAASADSKIDLGRLVGRATDDLPEGSIRIRLDEIRYAQKTAD